MTPPPITDSRSIPLVGPNVDVPLAQWQKGWMDEGGKAFDSFDSETYCEDYRTKLIQGAQTSLQNAPQGIELMPSERRFVEWAHFLGAFHAQCRRSAPKGKPLT